MKTKKILKNIAAIIVLEAIVVAAVLLVGNRALGDKMKSTNVEFTISRSMIGETTEYITVFVYGYGDSDIKSPKMEHYYCIDKTAVSRLKSTADTYILTFDEDKTKALESNKDTDIIIAFADKNDSIVLKSGDIRLETIPFIRGISNIELSNTGIQVHYMYKIETITFAAMALTLVFYLSHVSKKETETAAKEEKKDTVKP